MKQIILSIVIALAAIVATAQMEVARQLAKYEAANWQTWLLHDRQQITINPSPGTTQSKAELKLIKKGLEK
ncbi:MAG TPA: hypothetical protein VKA92_05440, partial [Segetibacter sp.]|nr:hypothetical protein [Segetibacter sp.]